MRIVVELLRNKGEASGLNHAEWSTLQELQKFGTNATVSKYSDFSCLMMVYENFFLFFEVYLRN